MKIKHIHWITIVGLIAIIGLQYVWLTNTYRLTRETIRMKSNETFKDAALQEVLFRMKSEQKKLKESDSVICIDLGLEEESDTLSDKELQNRASKYLISTLHMAFQEVALRRFQADISLPVLDSIYTHLLDSIGIRAEVVSCITDSTGKILHRSKELSALSDTIQTDPIPIDYNKTRFLKGFITNPYHVVFQRLVLLLIGSLLIMASIVTCIVWQIRIILRQNKVARLREDFSYAMIHDMKTPLSSILMGTQILETGKLDAQPEKKARYFRIMKEESEHLLTLINKVLSLAKLETHQLKLEKTEVALRPLLEDLAEKYKAQAVKPITFRWELQETTTYADEEFLKEAISNLIDNAVKYSGERVEITVSVERLADGMTEIAVRDNGFGIPLKDQTKIFEKYERASAAGRSRKGGAPGFGLGLNYVFRIAEAHKGSVKLESIEGEYSRFAIVLPPEERRETDEEKTTD